MQLAVLLDFIHWLFILFYGLLRDCCLVLLDEEEVGSLLVVYFFFSFVSKLVKDLSDELLKNCLILLKLGAIHMKKHVVDIIMYVM